MCFCIFRCMIFAAAPIPGSTHPSVTTGHGDEVKVDVACPSGHAPPQAPQSLWMALLEKINIKEKYNSSQQQQQRQQHPAY